MFFTACGTEGDEVCVNLLFPGEFAAEGVRFSIQTRYPFDGLVSVRIQEARPGVRLRIYAPYQASGPVSGFRQEGCFAVSTEPLRPGSELFFRMPLPARLVPALFAEGKFTVRLGSLIYACENGNLRAGEITGLKPALGGSRLTDAAGHSFIPLTRSTFTSRGDILKTDWQLLF